MEFVKWCRLQWDRALAVAAIVAGVVLVFLGWIGVSDTPYIAKQVPFVVSYGIGGLVLIIIGATLWLSADMNDEWRTLDDADSPLELDYVFTRRAPVDWPTPPGRITREALEAAVVPAAERPRVFVCGSTGFVERVADWLVELGHEPRSIRTERYGGA